MAFASAPCPRCPSDSHDAELVVGDDGILEMIRYTCRICSVVWVQQVR